MISITFSEYLNNERKGSKEAGMVYSKVVNLPGEIRNDYESLQLEANQGGWLDSFESQWGKYADHIDFQRCNRTVEEIIQCAVKKATEVIKGYRPGGILGVSEGNTVETKNERRSANAASRVGDTKVHKVMNLEDGFSLWRCENAVGVPYSYIIDRDGNEIRSTEAINEASLVKGFYNDLAIFMEDV